MKNRIQVIQSAYADVAMLQNLDVVDAIESCIADLDAGKVCVVEKINNIWRVNDWVKQAILLYFRIKKVEYMHSGVVVYNDKIPLKSNWQDLQVRVVPPSIARYGSFIDERAVLMACYINIGASIGKRTMVDINSSIGSCAQIGEDCHISANAVIGGVLEPVQATPVIIEDGVFVGAGTTIVEGVHVCKEAVIASHVCITGSTKIIDVTQPGLEYRAYVPERSVVIPGTYSKSFATGTYNISCALIIGQRTEQTDRKVSLNTALRDYNIA